MARATTMALAAAAAGWLAASPAPAGPAHEWKQTDASLALLRGGKVVWQVSPRCSPRR